MKLLKVIKQTSSDITCSDAISSFVILMPWIENSGNIAEAGVLTAVNCGKECPITDDFNHNTAGQDRKEK